MSDVFERRFQRERAARKHAEALLESKASELFRLNEALSQELTERTRGLYLSRVAMDLASDGVFMLSADGSFVYLNDVACRWLGYSLEELSEKSIFDIEENLTPQDWSRRWEALRSRGGAQMETSIRSRSGVARAVELTASHLEFEGREYSIAFVRDVSERKRIEAERVRREAENRRLSLIAARTSNAVVLTDRAGRIEWINEGFTRMTGFSAAEAEGHTPGSLLQGPDTDPAVVALMRENVEAGLGFEVEIVNYSKDGRRYWVSIEAQPLHDDNGEVEQFMAIETDITQRKDQMEREGRLARLRKISGEVLTRLIDDEALTPTVERLLSEVGRFLATSRARLVPVRPDSRLGDLEWRNPRAGMIAPRLDLAQFAREAGLGATSSRLVIHDAETWNGPETARSFLLDAGLKSMLAMPVVVSHRLEGVIAFEDFEQVRSWDAEEISQVWSTVRALWLVLERQGRKRLLEQQATQLAREAALAARASQEKSSFLANMSHEIRTPMTAIVGYADLLVRNPDSAKLRGEWADALRSNANYLLSLVTDVLDLSKIEAGELELKPERCRLDTMLGDVLAIVRPRVREKLLELRAHASSRVPYEIESDPIRLRQILVNLLVNAVKFTEEGSIDVTVGSRVAEGRVVLEVEVSDTGSGIDGRDLERMFEKFTQGGAGSASLGGTGLGLPISRSLARLLGGDIVANSTVGTGTVFTIWLDAGAVSDVRWLEAADFDPWAPTSNGLAESSARSLETLRVLVVDDNIENVRILRFVLEDAGAAIEDAANGREGVDAVLRAEAEGRPFDAILMDMSMPVLDGYAATRELRAGGCESLIVALTAYAMAGDEERCRKAGCDRYMTKPIVAEKLLSMLSGLAQVDTAGSAEASGGSTAFDLTSDPALAKLVDEYAGHFASTAREIQEACDRLDSEAVGRIAHRLRGTAANYGFPAVGEAAACCEDVIRGDRPWSEVAARAAALVRELDRRRSERSRPSPASL
jgi:PAS domain S-box-containing protein